MIRSLTGKAPVLEDGVFLAPSADVIGDVKIGTGSSVWFGAVVRGDMAPVRIGSNSNVQDGCVVHTDTGLPALIGDYVTIGHRAVAHGCQIRDRALIGMGAVILNGAVVGEAAVVGAGAVVPEGAEIPANALAVGVPARVVRDLGPDNPARRQAHAEEYRRLWEDNYRGLL